MATTKKSPVKKTTTRKAPVKAPAAKRATAVKAPAKRATTVRTKRVEKKANWKLPKDSDYQSFKVSKPKNFFSVRITNQTVYWAVLGLIVLALGIWVVTINDKVQHIYDQIDAQSADDSIVVPTKKIANH